MINPLSIIINKTEVSGCDITLNGYLIHTYYNDLMLTTVYRRVASAFSQHERTSNVT